jgi:Ca2+-transporting ATPase
MLVMVPFVFFVNGFTKGDWFEAFIFALSVAVGLTPEMLPMIVTANLSKGAVSMSKKKTVVKNLNAIQNFGAMNILCTDKTGTLTQNLMQVHEPNFYGLKNNGQLGNDDLSKLVMEGISANSTAFLEEEVTGEKPKGVGNPTEVALLLWLNSQGCDYLALREKATVIDQLTFSTERKFMATLVQSPLIGKKVLYVKGAPEIVLGKCKDVMLDGKRVDAVEYRSTVEAQLLNYQNMAMRTLGFAFKIVDDAEASDCVSLVAENDLSFLGVVAISDPIRPDVPAAVAKCQSAGIGVKIVTGDTPGTATEIARQIGLWKPEDTEKNRITGAAFAELTDEEALDRVMDLKIMSRARPTDKQRLVQLLQQKGAVVAVTGDGTNDAPALNHAQVGLSMGTGTSVAKEASDITLLDDSFNSIGTAVMWGRSLYKNIQRFIVFQLTINFVALFIVLLGSLVGTTLPLTVTQMLWVNLIMDTFAALALASIPPSESVMKEKPRKSTDFIITKSMRYYILGMGSAFLVLLMGMLFWFNSEEGGMTTYRLTVFFTFFVMLQFWNLFNARVFGTSDSAFKGISKSYGMELIILAILGGQILIVQFGGAVFRTVPLDFMTWMTIVVSTSFVLWIGELVRLIRRLTQK